jgi:hypothetical protein
MQEHSGPWIWAMNGVRIIQEVAIKLWQTVVWDPAISEMATGKQLKAKTCL